MMTRVNMMLAIAALMVAASCATAQELLRPSFGMAADWAENQHASDFGGLPGTPSCCPSYTGGSGSGFAIGAFARLPFSPAMALHVRADVQSHNASLTSTKQTTLWYQGVVTSGAFTYTLDATLMSGGIAPMLDVRVLGDGHIMTGARAGFMMTKQFTQAERITEPANGGTFADSVGNDSQSRTRNQLTGPIPDASSVQLAALVGVSYDLPLNRYRTLVLSPEVLYSYALTPVVSGLPWKAHAVRAGITVAYSPRVFRDLQKTEEHADTLRLPSELVTTETYVRGAATRREEVAELDDTRIITTHVVRVDTIYTPLPKPVGVAKDVDSIALTGSVVDSRTRKPISDARITWKLLPMRDTSGTVATEKDGTYRVMLRPTRTYEVSAQSPSHFFDVQQITMPATHDPTAVVVHQFALAETLALRVNFPVDNADKPYEFTMDENGQVSTLSAMEAINLLADNLKQNRERLQQVRLIGHTDSSGTDAHNDRLGLRRAQYVKDELVKRGIPESVITVESRGMREPVARRPGEADETFATRCRRTELSKVMKP